MQNTETRKVVSTQVDDAQAHDCGVSILLVIEEPFVQGLPQKVSLIFLENSAEEKISARKSVQACSNQLNSDVNERLRIEQGGN